MRVVTNRCAASHLLYCVHVQIGWVQRALARHAPQAVPLAEHAQSAACVRLDERAMEDLRAALGEDQVRALLERGLQTYHGYCDDMERDLRNPAAVAAHAHKIKGSAGTLGLTALTAAAAEIEAAALVGNVRQDCVGILRTLIASAESTMSSWG